MVNVKINGKEYKVEEGCRLITILDKKAIRIPHICFHHALTPAASCKLCVVEIQEKDNPPTTKLACAIKTKEGIEITTESAMIHEQRKKAMGKLLSMAPQSKTLLKIGAEFGLTTGEVPDGCIRCRLCMRVCKEIIGASALTMVKRNGKKHVGPSINGECIGCGTCANICPTKAIKIVDSDSVRTMMVGDQVIAKHPLIRCEMCGRLFATLKFLKQIEKVEKEKHHPDLKEHHDYCPTCSKLSSKRSIRLTATVFSKPHGYKSVD